jgi:hypothetical protein
VVSSKPYRIIDFKKLQLRREEFIKDQGELLGLGFEEADLLMRFLRYNKNQIEQFMLDSKFHSDTRINAGISGEYHDPPKPNSDGLISCGLFCDDVKPDEGTPTWLCMCCMSTSIYIHTHIHTYIHIHIYTHTFICMCIHLGYTCTSCGHFICNDCWSSYLQVEVESGVKSVFTRCPGLGKDQTKCTQVVPFSIMERFLLPHRLRKLNQWIISDYIR